MGSQFRFFAQGLALALPAAASLLGAGVAQAQDFEAVLAAPDDVELNLGYAREQARQGHLSEAATTLERILINNPDRHTVRLFYAVTLYRLGDLQTAKAQLEQLEGAPLSPDQRAEAVTYSRHVDNGLAPSSVGGSFSAGIVYDDNASGLYFTEFDFFGSPVDESGTSSELSLSLHGSTRIGTDRVWEAYGRAHLMDRSSLDGAAIDYQRADIEAGLLRQTRLVETRLAGVVRHNRLEGEPQLTEVGARASLSWRYTNQTSVGLRIEAVDQNFDEPAIDSIAGFLGGDRDGVRFTAGIGMVHRLTARTTLRGNVDYDAKSAGYEPFGYSGPRISASVDQRFDRGVYLIGQASMRWLEYDAEDPFFLFGETREDDRAYARVTVGAPLAALGAAGSMADDVNLEGAVSYSRRESTSPIADYDGWSAELRLVWRFGARN
ncbi:hypothetical protein GVN24_27880 [Rhizobium sp. CRIBSB]|nr:hypothetical protein [Rhizobium sp. CRIBSB]